MKALARIALILLVVVLIGTGCRRVVDEDGPVSQPSGLTVHATSTADGDRHYRLYVPDNLGGEVAPAVVLLHGRGGSAQQVVGGHGRAPSSRWLDVAKRDGLILLIPEGTTAPDGKQGWNDCRADAISNPETDDVAFIEQILDEVAQRVPIDRTAVYATGLSNGGHLALRLAIERPDLVAGIGAVAAAMPGETECASPTEPVAVLLMNGTDDPVLPFTGGRMAFNRGLVLGASESIAIWADLAESESVGGPARLPDVDGGDDSTVTRTDYLGSEPVSFYIVEGGGHTEPSRSERQRRFWTKIAGPQNGDIEMADEIWAFFEAAR